MKPRWECYGPYEITFRDASGNEMDRWVSYFNSLDAARVWAREIAVPSMDPRPVAWDVRVYEGEIK